MKAFNHKTLLKYNKGVAFGFSLALVVLSINLSAYSQTVGTYVGIDYATDYTNPDMGGPCASIALINDEIGDADFVNGSAEVPLGWSFSGTWNSGATYFDGAGSEVLLVSLHTYTESWNVALRLSDGTTTAFLPYDLTIVTTNANGSLAACGGMIPGPFNYERPSQELDFASYVIPPGEGVIGIVFEPFSDGAGNPDPHGVIVLEGTIEEEPCTDMTTSVSDTELCEGESLTLEATSTVGGTVTWDMGVENGVPFIPPVGVTTYTATSDSSEDCSFSVDITVHPLPDVTATASSDEICFGESVTVTGGGAATYSWDMGVIDGEPFTPGSIGTFTYTVTGTSAEGCVNTADVTVDVVDCEPVIAGFTFDNNVCLGDCITFTDTSVGSTIVSWEWDFGGGGDPATSTEQDPIVCFNTVGDFNVSLTITSLYGQVSSSTQTITVNEIPVIVAKLDTIIDAGDEANLIATSTFEGEFTWTPEQTVDCPTCPITTANPLDSTLYTVHFIDNNGCQTQDNVLIMVNFIEGVGVPTGFSPNGDGVNDVLFVKGFGLASINFVIYNRYGEVVFETTDQSIGWDGTFKKRDQNPGVFTWVLQYDFISGKKGMQKGNTTLIR